MKYAIETKSIDIVQSYDSSAKHNHSSYVQAFIRSYIRNKDAIRETAPEYEISNLPEIVKEDLLARRKSRALCQDSSNDGGEEIGLHMIESQQNEIVVKALAQAFINQHAKLDFEPNFASGGAMSVMIELGLVPTWTDVMLQHFGSNCFSCNYAGDYDVDTGWNSHLSMEKMSYDHEQDTRLLGACQLLDTLLAKGIKVDDCSICECDPSQSYGDQIEELELEKIDKEGMALVLVKFLLFEDYCRNGIDIVEFQAMVKDDDLSLCEVIFCRCLLLGNTYETNKKPLGNPGIYIPPCLFVPDNLCLRFDELSSTPSPHITKVGKKTRSKKQNGKKKSRKKKKDNYTHGRVISQLTSNLFEAVIMTLQRPSMQYIILITHLSTMFTKAVRADMDIAISLLCIKNQTGAFLFQLQQKALDYSKTLEEASLLPKTFVLSWWQGYSLINHIFMESLSVILSKGNSQLCVKALGYFRLNIFPELIKNISSNSMLEIHAGWKCLKYLACELHNSSIVNLLCEGQIWSSFLLLCKKDIEAYLDGQDFSSETEKVCERDLCFNAIKIALSFVGIICKVTTQTGTLSRNRTLLIDLLVRHDIVGLCLVCGKKEQVRQKAMGCLAILCAHKEVHHQLWEQRNDFLQIISNLLVSNTCVDISTATGAVLQLLEVKGWKDSILGSLNIPLEKVCLKWIVFGMKSLCDHGLDIQEKEYLRRQQLTKKASKCRSIEESKIKSCDKKKLLSSNDQDVASLDSQTFLDQYRKYCLKKEDDSNGENLTGSLETMKLSMILMANLIAFRSDVYDTTRTYRKYLISTAVLLLDPFNSKLFNPACTALEILCKNNCCEPSDFPNPHYFVNLLTRIVMNFTADDLGEEVYQMTACISSEMVCSSKEWSCIFQEMLD